MRPTEFVNVKSAPNKETSIASKFSGDLYALITINYTTQKRRLRTIQYGNN